MALRSNEMSAPHVRTWLCATYLMTVPHRFPVRHYWNEKGEGLYLRSSVVEDKS